MITAVNQFSQRIKQIITNITTTYSQFDGSNGGMMFSTGGGVVFDTPIKTSPLLSNTADVPACKAYVEVNNGTSVFDIDQGVLHQWDGNLWTETPNQTIASTLAIGRLYYNRALGDIHYYDPDDNVLIAIN